MSETECILVRMVWKNGWLTCAGRQVTVVHDAAHGAAPAALAPAADALRAEGVPCHRGWTRSAWGLRHQPRHNRGCSCWYGQRPSPQSSVRAPPFVPSALAQMMQSCSTLSELLLIWGNLQDCLVLTPAPKTVACLAPHALLADITWHGVH